MSATSANRLLQTLLCWLLVAGLPTLSPASAEPPIWTARSTTHVESLSLSDGLSDSTIFSISQDQLGRIWLGSAAGGANVYDGYQIQFFVHQPQDPLSLSNSAAGQVLATSRGEVLIGTWGGGLNRLTDLDGSFEHLNPNSAPRNIQIMTEDASGSIWVGSADAGLFRLEPGSSEATPVNRPDGRPFSRVWSLSTGPSGQLWLADAEGVHEVHSGKLLPAPAEGWLNHPRALAFAAEQLWVGDEGAVYGAVPGQVPKRVISDLPLVNTLAQGPDGEILIGTLAGVRSVSPEGRIIGPFGSSDPVMFPERNIRAFHVDEGGVSWLATREAGAIKVQPTVSGFDGYRLDSELDTVDAMLELASDDILIGSRRGLWRLRQIDGENRFEHISGSDANPVIRMRREGDRVLVGTGMGIFRFDPATGTLAPDPRFAEVRELMVTALRVSEDGQIDVGTWADGLFRYGPEGLRAHLTAGAAAELPATSIADIEADGNGGIWLALWEAGAVHIRADGQREALDRDKLGIDGTLHDLLLSGDLIWAATSFGLTAFDLKQESNEQLVLIPDYPNTAVQRLALGGGRLWAATTRGVIAIDLDHRSTTRFGTTDGLVVDEFYARSGDEGADGRIYFGGLGGFVSFEPEQVALSLKPPSAAVVGAWADGNPLALNPEQALQVPSGVASLRLRYIAADYRHASANRFRWRLQGDSGKDWSRVSATPEALLSGLKPGHYLFELQAASGNGLWGREVTQLPIDVLPAWWQTAWGQIAGAFSVLIIGWLWTMWHTQRIRMRNRMLQGEVERQTEALREANASLAVAAFTDYLTGLLNRRGFLSRIDESPAPEEEHYALIDADNFKSFNDIYGHDVGDLVLKHLADCLRGAVREDEDLAARWGGEEFIFCVRDATDAEALEVAERVRQAVSSQPLAATRPLPKITVTIGLSRRRPGEDAIQAINRADECLLHGKAQGKNRVVVEAA